MREVRLFGTYAELMHDYGGYPTGEGDKLRVRGNKWVTLVNEERNSRVYWFCEEHHDILQAISGLEISHLFLAHTVTKETAEWAMTRVRYPQQST